MNRSALPTFLEGALVAAVASAGVAVGYGALQPLMPGVTALRIVLGVLACGYVLYLLLRSRGAGRVVTFVAWALAGLAATALTSGWGSLVCAHLVLVWAVRASVFHTRALGVLADAALCGVSLLLAAWAFTQTHSLFLTTWCALLAQGAFVRCPGLRAAPARGSHAARFDTAATVAARALRNLARP